MPIRYALFQIAEKFQVQLINFWQTGKYFRHFSIGYEGLRRRLIRFKYGLAKALEEQTESTPPEQKPNTEDDNLHEEF